MEIALVQTNKSLSELDIVDFDKPKHRFFNVVPRDIEDQRTKLNDALAVADGYSAVQFETGDTVNGRTDEARADVIPFAYRTKDFAALRYSHIWAMVPSGSGG
ncbi:hypothetical protein GIY30_01945 [Gordonia sp. HNM0687]|uniref:Uncharacterized protein n=1 Tax=Gordonia mangrovi TaxID=2665643 RepID=A0A6L7GKR1_9ACTN|nr:hypothetical protein [Gordonia mangrovi]MXP20132.1 hypothetical protein [Gordonia mangrovi]UVF79259.1 hypothetical protein NWF22_05300 [Gordonia mangrovi]